MEDPPRKDTVLGPH